MPRFKKGDIAFHCDHWREHAAINIKVRGWIQDVKLPMSQGRFSTDGGKTWTESFTTPGFTLDWIEEHLADRQRDDWFWIACNDAVEMMIEDAKELFPGVKFWQEGRSGGWLVGNFTHGDVEGWDAIMVSKWGMLSKWCHAYRSDFWRSFANLVYHNVFLPWKENQDGIEEARLTAEAAVA